MRAKETGTQTQLPHRTEVSPDSDVLLAYEEALQFQRSLPIIQTGGQVNGIEDLGNFLDRIDVLDQALKEKIEIFLRSFCPKIHQALEEIRSEIAENSRKIKEFKEKAEKAESDNVREGYIKMYTELEVIQSSLKTSALKISLKVISLFTIHASIQNIVKEKDNKTQNVRRRINEMEQFKQDRESFMQARVKAKKIADFAGAETDEEIAKISPEIVAIVNEITKKYLSTLMEESKIILDNSRLIEDPTQSLTNQIREEITDLCATAGEIDAAFAVVPIANIIALLANEPNDEDTLDILDRSTKLVLPYTKEFDSENDTDIKKIIIELEENQRLDSNQRASKLSLILSKRKRISAEEVRIIFDKFGQYQSIQEVLAEKKDTPNEILQQILKESSSQLVFIKCFNNPNVDKETLGLVADEKILVKLFRPLQNAENTISIAIFHKNAPTDLMQRIIQTVENTKILNDTEKKHIKFIMKWVYIRDSVSPESPMIDPAFLNEWAEIRHKVDDSGCKEFVAHKQVTDELVLKKIANAPDHNRSYYLIIEAIRNPRPNNNLGRYYFSPENLEGFVHKDDMPRIWAEIKKTQKPDTKIPNENRFIRWLRNATRGFGNPRTR